ncbi:torsin-1A-like isoform X2 [Babylonia areolata]|uniref:torsin-1A-like isoform X2 n=1 Tax=Babylonia areolata TaxID=304850 RepID=UPI003FD5C07B
MFISCKRYVIFSSDLKYQLEMRLYGQHLVSKAVTSHLLGHLQLRRPLKALTLSFHGPTGTGKNHVSRIITAAMFKKGMNSEYVRFIAVTKEFPHQQKISIYKDRLRDIVEKQVKKCPQSLFIFDEIDKLPGGLIDTIKPYLDYHEQLGGVDYRHAIFIFLSNTGGESITQYVLQRRRDGGSREDIGLADVENVLAKAALNSQSKGGLWHSQVVSMHLVTAFIPFLPLERRHVRQCIQETMLSRRYYRSAHDIPRSKVDQVMGELTFYPPGQPLFSATGCKRVAEKVDYVMF